MSDRIGAKMGKAATIVMAGILTSRAIGFFREFVIARTMGADSETDIYYAAFTIPDFLNYLLAGGAMSITFIPIFTRLLAECKEEEGYRVFSTVINFMSLAMVFLIVLGEIFARDLVPFVARGFEPWQKERLAYFVRIVLPAQYCFYIGGILMAVQFAREKFFIPVLAPIIYNVGIIAGGLILGPKLRMAGFCYGVLAGAAAGPLLLQVWGARRVGARYYPVMELRNPAFREFILLTIPIMLGFSLVLVDEWIIKYFASYLVTASISWLNFARILMRIPVAVVGNAVGMAAYPFLARLAGEGRHREWGESLQRSIRGVILLVIPLAAWMLVLADDITASAFLSSRFTIEDCRKTASILRFLIPGIIAWGLQALIARGFYSLKNTWIPTVAGSLASIAAVPLYWMFLQLGARFDLPQEGLALASSIAILAYLAVLSKLLEKKTGIPVLSGAMRGTGFIILPAVLSAAAAGLLRLSLNRDLVSPGIDPLLRLTACGAFAALVFIASARLLAPSRFTRFVRMLTRRDRSGD